MKTTKSYSRHLVPGRIAILLVAAAALVPDVVMGTLFVVGLGFGGAAIKKFKDHGEDPQRNKLTAPVIYALAAAFLIGLPAFLNMTKTSTLGSGDGNSLSSGVYNTVGQ